jgi:cytosine/adenosine deaminase-related metal-dependent hydrolase
MDRPGSSSAFTTVVAGRLFDSLDMKFLDNQIIIVSETTGLIHDVHTATPEELQRMDWSDHSIVDLREATVLPGFVDAHVHCSFSITLIVVNCPRSMK